MVDIPGGAALFWRDTEEEWIGGGRCGMGRHGRQTGREVGGNCDQNAIYKRRIKLKI